jgi:PEP-utilising enzyme, mobile domain
VAVVTDGGTLAAHASLVAREYGIPAVVATGDATIRLADGQVVTVDGGASTVHPPRLIGPQFGWRSPALDAGAIAQVADRPHPKVVRIVLDGYEPVHKSPEGGDLP